MAGRGGSHVRVRAGHADRNQAGRDSEPRRHTTQSRHREFRRSHPRAERTRAPLTGDRPGVPLCAIAGVSADQHRPDRRNAGRDRGELARLHPEDTGPRARQRHDLSDGAPLNTTISKDLLRGTKVFAEPVVNWATKRRWVGEAFEALERAGYHVRSAYTAVKDPSRTKFLYTDRLWQGADMVGLGVASFGHVNGVHVQNADTWESYSAAVGRGDLPLNRAYRPTHDERMIRELVLQLKLGSVRPSYFRNKYGVDLLDRFRDELASLSREGSLQEASNERIALTREGLLRVDVLLPRFFHPEHVGIRYT